MSIVAWVVLGALVGLLAHRVFPGRYPYGVAGTVGGEVIGASLGGAVFSVIASRGVGGSIWSASWSRSRALSLCCCW